MQYLNQWLYTDNNHSAENQLFYKEASARGERKGKERKGVPALLSISLTWDTNPSWKVERAGVPLLDWGGLDTAWHSAFH